MITQIIQIQCNSCQAIIPAPNANGAVRLKGTEIDFCPECAEKAVSFVATTFTVPTAPPTPRGFKTVQLHNGNKIQILAGAPTPPGATVVT